jgi:hypothetical protein
VKHLFLSVSLALTCLAGISRAASVAGTGYTNHFANLPGPGDWSSLTLAGGSDDIKTSNALDALAQTTVASTVTTTLLSDVGNPPAPNGPATWSSTGFYLQTRPTSVKATLLMATFVNNTGTNCNALIINYDFETNRAPLVTEEVLGHLVYYSLTGAAGNWIQIPALCSATPGLQRAMVNLASNWNEGSTLYLLWVDDNGSGSPDDAIDIGNFGLAAYAAPLPVTITTEPTPQFAVTNDPVTFTVAASGTGLGYFWYKSPSAFLSAIGPSFTIASVQPSDAGDYFVVVSNSINSVTSTVVALTLLAAYEPPSILQDPQSQSATAGTRITFSVVATGTPTLCYQWYKNGTNLAGATSTSYSIASVQPSDEGNYFVVVTNAGGAVTSIVAVLTVDPFTWTTNNGTITITGYIGSGGPVTIPDTIGGLPVTSIKNSAFYYARSITSVTIPNSVTNIGYQAFWGCTGLTEITVDESNPAYRSPDGVLFNKDQTTLIQYPLGKPRDYTVPDTVTRIEDYAFQLSTSLTNVTLPGGHEHRLCSVGFLQQPDQPDSGQPQFRL